MGYTQFLTESCCVEGFITEVFAKDSPQSKDCRFITEERRSDMKSADDLRQLLQNIDRKSYPAYKGTKGVYRFGKYALGIDHVQGDPFAAPSSLHIEVSGKVAAFPERLYDETWKRIALEDYLIRQFGAVIGKYSFQAKTSVINPVS